MKSTHPVVQYIVLKIHFYHKQPNPKHKSKLYSQSINTIPYDTINDIYVRPKADQQLA